MTGGSGVRRRPHLAATTAIALAMVLGGVSTGAAPAATTAQASAPAIAAKAADSASMEFAYDIAITVRADRSAEEIRTRRVKVLGEAAVRAAGQHAIRYIAGMETLDIVDAHTLKADGRKIAVEPENIITRDGASGSLFHLRDLKVRTVIFSDVDVGDTIVLTTRRITKSGIFPGHYYRQFAFSRATPYAPSTIRISAPTDLKLKVATLGDGLTDNVVSEGDVTRHEIRYRPLPRRFSESGSVSIWDRDPRVLISTFENYQEQAKSYWAQTSERVQVTPKIQALADTITAGITDRRAQAVAIDRWVKRNIRYVAIYLGRGRVIPYAAASVLKHKFGDCKDHATLMTALLAAKGIASEHVLISSGTAYTLPEPATMAYINHVILYLPEFGVYDDPTASTASFGVLGSGSYDKPVIHVSDAGARRAQTPTMKAADHTLISRTRLKVAADGSVTGETKEITTGVFAMGARRIAGRIQSVGPVTAAEKQLRSLGTPGSGRFEIGSLSQLNGSYVVKSSFTYNDRMNVRPRAVQRIPLGLPTLIRPGSYLFGKRYRGRRLPFVCRAGRQVEEIQVTFAEGLALPRRIYGRTIDTRLFGYASHYWYGKNTMKVRRVFESRVPGQVCAPEVEAEIAADLRAVRGSINTRMRFKAAPIAPAAKRKLSVDKVDSGIGSRAPKQAALLPPAAPAASSGKPQFD